MVGRDEAYVAGCQRARSRAERDPVVLRPLFLAMMRVEERFPLADFRGMGFL